MPHASLQSMRGNPGAAPKALRSRQRSNRVCISVLAAALLWAAASAAWGQSPELCRVGFTSQAFGALNENDAMAAMRAWTQAFVEERKIPAILEPSIYKNIQDMKTALSEKTVEALNMTTVEFWQLQGLVAEDVVIYGVAGDSINEEYLLLVNRSSAIEALGALAGRTLGMLSSERASLATVWLDTILIREGLAPARDFFGRIEADPKPADLLLPLFFEKLDACVITRRGFDIMVELNPQTRQRLEILSASPPLVPTVFCFRNDWNPPVREKIVSEIERWHLSPAGRQSLALFQIDGLKAGSGRNLDTALDLLEEHRRLMNDYPPAPGQAPTPGRLEAPP